MILSASNHGRRDCSTLKSGNVVPRWALSDQRRGTTTRFVTALSLRLKLFIGFKQVENGFRYFVHSLYTLDPEYHESRKVDFDRQLCGIAANAFRDAADQSGAKLNKLDDRISGMHARYRASYSNPVPSLSCDPRSANRIYTEYCEAVENDFASKSRKILEILALLCQLSKRHNNNFPTSQHVGNLYSETLNAALDDLPSLSCQWAHKWGADLLQLPKNVNSFDKLGMWLKDSGVLVGAMRSRKESVIDESRIDDEDFFPAPEWGIDTKDADLHNWDCVAPPALPAHSTASVVSVSDDDSDHDDWTLLDIEFRRLERRLISDNFGARGLERRFAIADHMVGSWSQGGPK